MPSTFHRSGSSPAASRSVTARATSAARGCGRRSRRRRPAASCAGVGGTITSSMRSGPPAGSRAARSASAATDAAFAPGSPSTLYRTRAFTHAGSEREDAVDDPGIGEREVVEPGRLHRHRHESGPRRSRRGRVRRRTPRRSAARRPPGRRRRPPRRSNPAAMVSFTATIVGRSAGPGSSARSSSAARCGPAVIAREHEPRVLGRRHRRRSVPVARRAPIRARMTDARRCGSVNSPGSAVEPPSHRRRAAAPVRAPISREGPPIGPGAPARTVGRTASTGADGPGRRRPHLGGETRSRDRHDIGDPPAGDPGAGGHPLRRRLRRRHAARR